MSDIKMDTIYDLSRAIKAGEVKVVDVVKETLDRIKNDKYNNYITINRRAALERAEEVQKLIDEGKLTGMMAGIPIAIKDNICTKGIKTTCASKILADFKPFYNATVVDRLEEAGAIVVAKVNMDEFAIGSTGETSAYGPALNPVNPEHVTGGSSSGSIGAVAANQVLCSLGTDTGGSIRVPASYCGVTGFKPTYGAVSRYGVVAYASSFDQVGPIAKDVRDTAIVYDVIAGHDPKDAMSAKFDKPDYLAALTDDVEGMTVGYDKKLIDYTSDPAIKEAVYKSLEILKEKGAKLVELELPLKDFLMPTYYIMVSAQSSSNYARFDGIKYGHRTKEYSGTHSLYCKSRGEGFGDEVKRRMMFGTFALSSGYYNDYYRKALDAVDAIKYEYDKLFDSCDVIVGPVGMTVAPKFGNFDANPVDAWLSDLCTIPANMAGIPAISIPVGYNADKMPIGLHVMARKFRDQDVFRAAYVVEQNINKDK